MWFKTKAKLLEFQKAERLIPSGLATAAVMRRAEELIELECGCEKDYSEWYQVNEDLGISGKYIFNYRTASELVRLSSKHAHQRSVSQRDAVVAKTEKVTTDPYKEEFLRSPNQSGKIYPKLIILHDSVGSLAGTISWIRQAVSRVSYHYVIRDNGNRVQMVWDSRKAWQAGKSYWKTVSGVVLNGLNSHSVSIALYGDTRSPHTGKRRKASDVEIDSTAWKAIELLDKFSTIKEIRRHRDISPRRKTDTSYDVEKRVKARIRELRPDLSSRLGDIRNKDN